MPFVYGAGDGKVVNDAIDSEKEKLLVGQYKTKRSELACSSICYMAVNVCETATANTKGLNFTGDLRGSGSCPSMS